MALTPAEIQRQTFFCYLNSVALNLEVAVGYYSNFRFWFKGACHASRICSLFLRLEEVFSGYLRLVSMGPTYISTVRQKVLKAVQDSAPLFYISDESPVVSVPLSSSLSVLL